MKGAPACMGVIHPSLAPLELEEEAERPCFGVLDDMPGSNASQYNKHLS